MRTFSKICAALVCLVWLSGCTKPQNLLSSDTVTTRTHVPTIAAPDKPTLEKMTTEELAEYAKLPETIRVKLEENNRKLMEYAEAERVAIADYNGFAKYSNQISDQK